MAVFPVKKTPCASRICPDLSFLKPLFCLVLATLKIYVRVSVKTLTNVHKLKCILCAADQEWALLARVP